jgi:signal transduction histidine kinase
VLVLYSSRRDAQIAIVGERELPRILDDGLAENVDYYSEYIDQARFPDSVYKAAFGDFLRLKYKGVRFDIVIAIHNFALEFVGENRDDLFADVPVVFFAASPVSRRIPNSTGIVAPVNFVATLDLAAELQPDVRQVFVVSGAQSDDRAFESLAREQFQSFDRRFTFDYLTGLTTEDLETRLRTLPEHSIVYYLVVNQDGGGENFHPLEYLDRIASVASAPIYCWVDSAIDRGIVGGSLKNQKTQMEAIGHLAVRVVRGEPAEAISISSPDLNVRQVDWRQLRRWGISEARVPAGTFVRFRELSAWDRYKVYILLSAALLIAQTGLIATMLVQRTRRRQAEEDLRGNQEKLSTSYERIRDLGGRLLNAQEAERARIARELHDDISQQLVVLTMDLELLASGQQPPPRQFVDEASARVRALVKSVHDLSHRLHPTMLRLTGLVPALASLQQELSQSEIPIVFTHHDVPKTLPPDLTVCLFRVVQEALHNTLKYSKAHTVSVDLVGRADTLLLTIVDDGVGFDVAAAWGKGLGLVSMSERVEAVGGTLEVRSTPGAGTRLEVAVPLPAVRAESAAV